MASPAAVAPKGKWAWRKLGAVKAHRPSWSCCCTARQTLAGYEAMAMVGKGQVRQIGGRDMRTQASFIAELFQAVA